LNFLRKLIPRSETAEEIGKRRNTLISVASVHDRDHSELIRFVEASDVDDLEWFAERLDHQIKAIELNVKPTEARDRLKKEVAKQRSLVGHILANKRTVEARRRRRVETRWKVAGLVVAIAGIVVGVVGVILSW
jgi:hypothetical protein